MKKSSALGGLFTFLTIIALIIVGSYFLLRLVIIPKVIIPKICNEVKAQLKQELSIASIDINRQGTVLINQPILYSPGSKNIMLECSQIEIDPSYRKIFQSWKKNSNTPQIPLNISIDDIKLEQNPITLTGVMKSDFLLKLDLKNKENIDWGGNIKLQKINIKGIPTLGNIANINGHIAVSKNSLVSYDIEGKINNEAAKLEILINDFKNPELILQGELFPLKFNLSCKLSGENLSIKELKANYNNIQLSAQGEIDDLKNTANAQINADISLALEDLKKLPLSIKDTLVTLNPQGLVKASIALEGPLKDIPALTGTIGITCPKVSLLDYEISDIKITSVLKNAKATLESLEAVFLKSELKAYADVNIGSKKLPFNAQIKIRNIKAELFKEKFAPDLAQNIMSDINVNIQAQGDALDLSTIKIQTDAMLDNIIFDKIALAQPLDLTVDMIFKDLKNIIIKKLTLDDATTSLIVDGRITDIREPFAKLAFILNTDLEKLKAYGFLAIPENLELAGKPIFDLNLSGKLLKYQSLDLAFKLSSPDTSINQFKLDTFDLKGQFKQMKLDISELNIGLYKGELSAKAYLDLADMKNLIFNSSFKIEDIDMEDFSLKTKILPDGFQGLLSTQFTLKGNGISPENLNADLKGTIAFLNAKMNNIAIDKAQAELQMQYINTDIELKNLKLVYKTIEATANGSIKSALKNPTVDLILKTNIALEDLNKLPFDFKKTLDELDLTGTVDAQVKASGPVSQWQQMNINTVIKSEELSVKKIKLSNIDISADLNNGILGLIAKTNSYDGMLDLKANAEFSDNSFKYNGTAKLEKVDIGKLIEDSKIIAQSHKGIFSINADFLGLGTNLDTIESGIEFNLEQAQISGLELMRSIGGLIGLNFLSEFEVNKAQGTLKLKNSNVHTEDTNIIGPEARIVARGDINLDQSLDIIVKLILSPESAAQTSSQVLDKFFTFDNDEYFTELDVKGTLTKPKPDISKFMRDRIGSQVKKEVGKQIFKALDGLFK